MSATDGKILGIHSSPFKSGNTAYFLQHTLDEGAKTKGVSVESIAIAGLSVADCRQCNWCMRGQTSDKLCAIEDEAAPILKKIRDCDLLVLASPVYFSRLSGDSSRNAFINRPLSLSCPFPKQRAEWLKIANIQPSRPPAQRTWIPRSGFYIFTEGPPPPP